MLYFKWRVLEYALLHVAVVCWVRGLWRNIPTLYAYDLNIPRLQEQQSIIMTITTKTTKADTATPITPPLKHKKIVPHSVITQLFVYTSIAIWYQFLKSDIEQSL